MEKFQEDYAAAISGPAGFEQTIAWPYLDTHKPPIVTVGVGCAIALKDAQGMKWTLAGGITSANPEDIANNFMKVSSMQPGMKAIFYRYAGCLILSDTDIMLLRDDRIQLATVAVRAVFPDFDTYPDTVKTGLIDMPFTLGARGFAVDYPLFIAAVKNQDWVKAAAECVRNASNPSYDRRNAWLKGLLLSAA